jgi:hypothetical protein
LAVCSGASMGWLAGHTMCIACFIASCIGLAGHVLCC